MDDTEDIVHMGARELRNALGRRVDAAYFRSEPTIITHNGEPRAVIIAYGEFVDTAGGGAGGGSQ